MGAGCTGQGAAAVFAAGEHGDAAAAVRAVCGVDGWPAPAALGVEVLAAGEGAAGELARAAGIAGRAPVPVGFPARPLRGAGRIDGVDGSLFWRVALIQAAAVAAVSLALAAALPKSFFEDWGWIAGPGAWLACSLLTARVLGLGTTPTLAGAAVAGLVSLAAVVAGVHWLGAALAVLVFAAWCARRDERGVAWTSA